MTTSPVTTATIYTTADGRAFDDQTSARLWSYAIDVAGIANITTDAAIQVVRSRAALQAYFATLP